MEKYITRSYLLNAINNYRRKMEAVGFTQNIVVGLNCEQYEQMSFYICVSTFYSLIYF